MQKLHKDITNRDIHKGDFIVYTSQGMALRVGLVVNPVADGWSGPYSYVRRKVKVVTLDYRDLTRAMLSASAPEITKIMVVNDIPQEQKDVLTERARELGYED